MSYIGLGDGSSTDSTVYIYAFDRNYHEQLLDSGTSSKLSAKSIKLSGKNVSWKHDGMQRTAKIGEVRAERHVRRRPARPATSPRRRRAASPATSRRPASTGTCIGSFAPDDQVTVTATGAASATVTISGGCSAVHAPVAGQASSVATCKVTDEQRARP